MVDTLTERHLLPMSTSATGLRRIGRVDFDEHSASFFRFAGELPKELRPCRITDAFRQTVIVHHAIHVQIFHADHAVAINNLAALLMSEVGTLESDTLMHTSDHTPVLVALSRALLQFGMCALHLCQCLFFSAYEARVFNLLRSGKGGKRLQSDINADLFASCRQTFRLAFDREADVPLASRGAIDGAGFHRALDGSVIEHLDRANLREAHTTLMGDAKATLGKGETIIAISTTKAWVSWVLTRFEATEEGFEGQIDTDSNILQDLRMHTLEGGAFTFEQSKRIYLMIARKALALLLVGRLTHLKKMVVQPPALRERFVELARLLFWSDRCDT